jgi:hypothetical protein
VDATLRSGGLLVGLRSEVPWVTARLREGADGQLVDVPAVQADLRVVVQSRRDPFRTEGWQQLTRDSCCRDGSVVVRDVATSGFDLRLGWDAGVPVMTFRHRPPARTRALGWVAPGRARLLLQAALLQFPVLWAAATSGRAPLHVATVEPDARGTFLVAGPSGVGKTTMVERAAAAGGRWTDDNLAVSDGRTVWGVVEPVRSVQGDGRAAPHGRRERRLDGRVAELEPVAVVVLGRGRTQRVTRLEPDVAARAIVTGTYSAGELRRYWPLHALLAMGTAVGPAHPDVQSVARTLTSRLPSFAVELPPGGAIDPGVLASTEPMRT